MRRNREQHHSRERCQMRGMPRIINEAKGQSAMPNIRSLPKDSANCIVLMREPTGTPGSQKDRGSASFNSRMVLAASHCMDFITSGPETSRTRVGHRDIGTPGASQVVSHHANDKSCRSGSSRAAGLKCALRPSGRSAKAKSVSYCLPICITARLPKLCAAPANQYQKTIKPILSNHATNEPANQDRHGLTPQA